MDKIWKTLPDISYTPNHYAWLHHALPQMREFDRFGDMLEDEVETSHQYCDNFAQRVAQMKSLELRVWRFSLHEKTINNPKVQLTIK